MNFQEYLARSTMFERSGEKLQIVIIGSPEGIDETIDRLYALRFSDVGSWSPIVPMPGSGASMSVLTRYRTGE